MSRCWILVGMMGAGKSSLGRALATASGRDFLDTDHLLQQRLGRSISQLFQIYGESTFRDHETALLRTLQPQPAVLSTGGGIVQRDENWLELRRLGVTVYLEADAETLIDRLDRSKKKRPLLQVDEWQERLKQLLEERRILYEKADLRFKVDDKQLDLGASELMGMLMDAEKC